MTAARLLLKKSSNGKTVALSGEMLVGRQPPAAVLLTEGQPSRRHAQLTASADGVTVEDLGSANGTFVNDQRISAKVMLKSGDRVRFDIEEFQFLVQEPVDPDKTMMRPPEALPPKVEAPPKSVEVPKSTPATAEKIKAKESPPVLPKKNAMVDPAGDRTKYIDPKEIYKDMPATPHRRPSAKASDVPCILVCSGESVGMEICLTRIAGDSQGWTVGSEEGRDIRLNDSGVSGLHARIMSEGERWKVVDLMSANGTSVNGKRTSLSYLRNGDRLKFGPVECVLHLPTARASVSVGPGKRVASRHKTSLVVGALLLLVVILLLVSYRVLK